MSCGGAGSHNSGILVPGEWQFNANYQYYKSFRHFRGDVEEHDRIEDGTQVENISHSVDLGITTAISHRSSITASIPFLYYDRSSLYEHYGNSTTRNPDQVRFHTGSVGMGDLRVTANYWLRDPMGDSLRGNLAIGGGIKLPTGQENVQDEFHKLTDDGEDSVFIRPVDQSIQLGDGGWGIILQVQGYQVLARQCFVFFNGFYLLNPQNTNNTWRRGTLINANPVDAYHSVADQYAARVGLNYGVLPGAGLSANLGGRVEGIPSRDLLGKSEGYRRPGMIVSVEPGVSWMHRQFNLAVNVPVALYRNRTKSYADKADPTGERHGDAAFADYLVSVAMTYRIGGDFDRSAPVPF